MLRIMCKKSAPSLFRSKTRLNIRRFHEISPPNPTPNSQDWFNFIISSSNCAIIISILWGFESYHQKLQLIEDTNYKITEICAAYKTLEKRCAPLTRQITKKTKNANFP